MSTGGGQTGDPTAYSGILVTEDINELRDAVFAATALFEADLKPQLASRARRAFLNLVSELEAIAREIAQWAHEEILRREVRSRVRPDTGGAGGPRLEDFIGESFPLALLPGSVGINFEPVLEDNVPWWWTNEEGYSGLEGHQVIGFFFDSGFTSASAPDQGRFREDPLFRPSGRGPTMTVERPIPDRWFVRDGYEAALARWHARVATARSRFDRESDSIWAAFNASP